MKMKRCLFRLLALCLCLLLAVAPALADSVRFDLRLGVTPDAAPEELQLLFTGIAQLLEATSITGAMTTDGDRFRLDAELTVSSDDYTSVTDVELQGMGTHWSLRTSLLGEEEVLIRCASILPFGMKARDYLDLPLDRAALAIPAVHADGLAAPAKLLTPLFPSEETKFTLSRAEMDDIIRELRRLCNEDPAFSRYLEVTGLYATVVNFCDVYEQIPVFILPSLSVRRSGNTITWTSGYLPLLYLTWDDSSVYGSFAIPAVIDIRIELADAGGLLTGSASIAMDNMNGTAVLSLPTQPTDAETPVQLKVDAVSTMLPNGELHLNIGGHALGNEVTVSLISTDGEVAYLTVTGTMEKHDAEPLPHWTADDMTGYDVLSSTGDSLQEFLTEVRWPLLEGAFNLIVAAPAPAVQSLMDYAEDSGLIDLLTESLSGGAFY